MQLHGKHLPCLCLRRKTLSVITTISMQAEAMVILKRSCDCFCVSYIERH